eukprot:1104895-Prymnesium_polylepis.1
MCARPPPCAAFPSDPELGSCRGDRNHATTRLFVAASFANESTGALPARLPARRPSNGSRPVLASWRSSCKRIVSEWEP